MKAKRVYRGGTLRELLGQYKRERWPRQVFVAHGNGRKASRFERVTVKPTPKLDAETLALWT
jgi:hypothetical protein